MRDIETNVEIDTGVGTKDGEAYIHYRIREAAGQRRLVADFDLMAEDAFRVHSGGARHVAGKISGEFNARELLAEALDMLTSPTGVPTDRSLAQIAEALRPAYSGHNDQVFQTITDLLAGDLT